MTEVPADRLMELYRLAAAEKDPKKLMDLAEEITRVLDECEGKSAASCQDDDSENPKNTA